MRVLLAILNSPPPSLPKHENWSPEFRHFVEHCLTKDPEQRPTFKQLLHDHKKFFSKAKDSEFIKTNFLKDLKPLDERQISILAPIAAEYYEKKARHTDPKRKPSYEWNFDSSGTFPKKIHKPEPVTELTTP